MHIWAELSLPLVPSIILSTYSFILFISLYTYGPTRTTAYVPLPKCHSAAPRPSCQDLVTLLRKQI